MIARQRRRMNIGTIQRIGDLTMRYGLRSQLARLDCTSSRRSTVMCALRRATSVTTEYQRDSSSKRPVLSVASAARSPREPGAMEMPCWLRAPPWPRSHAIDNRSFHIRVRGQRNNHLFSYSGGGIRMSPTGTIDARSGTAHAATVCSCDLSPDCSGSTPNAESWRARLLDSGAL